MDAAVKADDVVNGDHGAHQVSVHPMATMPFDGSALNQYSECGHGDSTVARRTTY